jgi:hypothetical protein
MNRLDRVLQEGSAVRIILILMCIVVLPRYKYPGGWISLPFVLIWSFALLYLGNELKRAGSHYFRKKRGNGVDLIDPDENM